MKFSANILTADKPSFDCLIVGVFEDGGLTPAASLIDAISANSISQHLHHGDFNGKLGTTLLLTAISALPSKRVLLVGCGNAEKLQEKAYGQIVKAAFAALENTRYQHIGFYLTELALPNRSIAWLVRDAIIKYAEVSYRFEIYKSVSKSNGSPKSSLESVTFFVPSMQEAANCEAAIHEGTAIAAGMTLTKNLGNMPCNDCTPSFLAKEAEQLAKQHANLKTTVIDEKKLIKMGFGAFTAVSQGSPEPCKLIILEYTGGNKTAPPIALVGKGITFDTGGLSLKPAASMLEMKFDMCGAATVLGVMSAIAALKLPIHVIGALAAAENMPDGNAVKPETIVKTLSGQTVEISNTDAEGRLVLCDTLTYIEQEYKPAAMIDIATLTGAIVVALGRVMSGLFSSNDVLAHELKQAASQAGEAVWQMPMAEDYFELLESSTADMMNASIAREAGASVAACFLAKFVKETPWAHLDIAGIANTSGAKKFATGRTVPMLVQYLINKT